MTPGAMLGATGKSNSLDGDVLVPNDMFLEIQDWEASSVRSLVGFAARIRLKKSLRILFATSIDPCWPWASVAVITRSISFSLQKRCMACESCSESA